MISESIGLDKKKNENSYRIEWKYLIVVWCDYG